MLKENDLVKVHLYGCSNKEIKTGNYNGEWKQLAEKVNRYYGYNIKRCDSADEKGISEEQKEKIQTERAARKVKYIFKCTCCGQKVERCRESKFIKYPELYRCAVCHGKFERIF